MSEGDDCSERMLGLWVRHQAEIHRFIYTMVPHASDAQDILQATCIALWRKAQTLDLERPFLPLAYSFAGIEIRRHRKANRRLAATVDDALIEILIDERTQNDSYYQARREALQGCLRKLPDVDRQLIRQRYEQSCSVQEIADSAGRKLFTVYKHLQRVRRQLWQCINSALDPVSET